jgi:hypothetical protein
MPYAAHRDTRGRWIIPAVCCLPVLGLLAFLYALI